MHGRGKYTFADGGYYDGEFRKDDFNGRGVRVWPNGDRYEGEWHNDNRTGHGKYFWPNGDRYEGEWYNGKKHGRGTYKSADGWTYIGEYKDDEMHGHGKFTFADGGYYEGEFRNDDFNGHGVRVWSNGDRYEGEWRNDKRNGQGFCKYDNKTYDGYWEDDEWKGSGKVIQNNGIEIEGIWTDCNNAKNVTLYENGQIYKGKIEDWQFVEAKEDHKTKYADKKSTARLIPADYLTQKALEEVKNNPFTLDAKILNLSMGDKTWPADKGWVKVERRVIIKKFVSTEINEKGEDIYDVIIHYVANRLDKRVDDFKIKDILLNGHSII